MRTPARRHPGQLVLEALAQVLTSDAATVDLNELAADLTLAEGLKVSITDAQVKELLGCLGRRWRRHPDLILAEVGAIVERAGQRGRR